MITFTYLFALEGFESMAYVLLTNLLICRCNSYSPFLWNIICRFFVFSMKYKTIHYIPIVHPTCQILQDRNINQIIIMELCLIIDEISQMDLFDILDP
mgnify:CR=1 FL=1